MDNEMNRGEDFIQSSPYHLVHSHTTWIRSMSSVSLVSISSSSSTILGKKCYKYFSFGHQMSQQLRMKFCAVVWLCICAHHNISTELTAKDTGILLYSEMQPGLDHEIIGQNGCWSEFVSIFASLSGQRRVWIAAKGRSLRVIILTGWEE